MKIKEILGQLRKILKKSHKESKVGFWAIALFLCLVLVARVGEKVKTLYEQCKAALQKGDTVDDFFAVVKKLKRGSIVKNIGTCIFALGIVTPGIMLMKRLFAKDDQEFQTKKEIREQLVKEGLIV